MLSLSRSMVDACGDGSMDDGCEIATNLDEGTLVYVFGEDENGDCVKEAVIDCPETAIAALQQQIDDLQTQIDNL